MSSKTNWQNALNELGISVDENTDLIMQIKDVFSGETNNEKGNISWNCQKCTFLNDPGAFNCDICGNAKDDEKYTWSCPICTFKNEMEKIMCSMCNTPNPVTIMLCL